ncbi:MAG TPA: hypothetical protein VE010_17980 [Thermoanaerobaculia bacterium]|nr:hypothetical protein [Thermoanaerobaculia bacterium]
MFKWLRKRLRIANPRDQVLHIGTEGVTLRDDFLDDVLWHVQWGEVQEIVAFKVDAYTVDCICLGFIVPGSSTFPVANEEMKGWDALNNELASRFGVVFDEWFIGVAFPAFARNETVLWRRATTGE